MVGQLPDPLHRYAPQVDGVPRGRAVQVPSATAPSEALHASHPPAHAVLQQTPSEQLPVAHWLPAEQAVPTACTPVQVPPTQLPDAHSAGRVHAFPEPSFTRHWAWPQYAVAAHSPSLAQEVPQPVDGDWHRDGPHSASGSVPACTGLQVPFEGARSHLRQLPVQSVLQQTPSTQKPEAQSVSALQAAPGAPPMTHVPATHEAPCAQPVEVVQAVVQAPPAPHKPGVQAGAPGLPLGAAVQVPALPGRLHASHAPLQAVLQHVPSAQWPEAQSELAAHAAPSGNWATQVLAVQLAPATQPAAAVHPWAHVPPAAHAKAPQEGMSGVPASSVAQWPVASHARQGPSQAASQHTPSEHWPDAHSRFPPHAPPCPCSGTQLPPSRYCPGAHSAHAPPKQERPGGQVMPRQSTATQRPPSHTSDGPHVAPPHEACRHSPPTHRSASGQVMPTQSACSQRVPSTQASPTAHSVAAQSSGRQLPPAQVVPAGQAMPTQASDSHCAATHTFESAQVNCGQSSVTHTPRRHRASPGHPVGQSSGLAPASTTFFPPSTAPGRGPSSHAHSVASSPATTTRFHMCQSPHRALIPSNATCR